VLLLLLFCQTVYANAECLETVWFNQHYNDTGLGLIEDALLQLLQQVKFHAFFSAVIDEQQTKFDRFLAHTPA
jgi:hypothetical protein